MLPVAEPLCTYVFRLVPTAQAPLLECLLVQYWIFKEHVIVFIRNTLYHVQHLLCGCMDGWTSAIEFSEEFLGKMPPAPNVAAVA